MKSKIKNESKNKNKNSGVTLKLLELLFKKEIFICYRQLLDIY